MFDWCSASDEEKPQHLAAIVQCMLEGHASAGSLAAVELSNPGSEPSRHGFHSHAWLFLTISVNRKFGACRAC